MEKKKEKKTSKLKNITIGQETGKKVKALLYSLIFEYKRFISKIRLELEEQVIMGKCKHMIFSLLHLKSTERQQGIYGFSLLLYATS